MIRVRKGWAGLAGLTIVAAALWIGCGVKSQPVPPQRAIPERIVGLSAAIQKSGILLTWERPEHYAAGGRMRNLDRFEVMRASVTGEYQKIGTVPVTDQQRFQQQRRFRYLDKDVQVGETYRYEITSETDDGYRSMPSNEAVITRTIPKPPPNPEHFVLPTPTPLP
jgi:hypothetical protein